MRIQSEALTYIEREELTALIAQNLGAIQVEGEREGGESEDPS